MLKKQGYKSRWKEWQIYMVYFFLCLFLASIGTYSVMDAINVLEAQNRSFQVEKLKYRRSPERRIVKGALFGLIGTTLAPIYAYFLIKEIRNRYKRSP